MQESLIGSISSTASTAATAATALGIVVIAHRQASSIALVLSALAKQVQPCDHVVVVIADSGDPLDEETFTEAVSASKTYCISMSVQFASHGIQGFNAGANRDQGTNYLLGQYLDLAGIVYLDGDCVPSPSVLDSFRNLFTQTQATLLPVVGCGVRAETAAATTSVAESALVSGTGERRTYDCRMNSITHGRAIFTPGVDRVMLHDRHVRASQVCWSCHCGLNMQAIQLLRKTNAALFGDVSRAWASIWDGNYGYEDTFVGLTCFRAGGLVVTLDPTTTYVMHQRHPKSTSAQKANINKQRYPLAAMQLARYLQCLHACSLLLHVRGYSENSASIQAGPASSIYDTLEFYNNILSVNVPAGSIEYVALQCLGLSNSLEQKECSSTDSMEAIQEQIALFQLARTLTVAYGSGTVLADKLLECSAKQAAEQATREGTANKYLTRAQIHARDKELLCPHDMCYHANSIWKTLLSACVSVPEFLRIYNSPEQQMLRAHASSIHGVHLGKEMESWDEETKHEVW